MGQTDKSSTLGMKLLVMDGKANPKEAVVRQELTVQIFYIILYYIQ